MSEKKSKIKEISIMVYRKFTEDFDSLGFRLGLSVEVRDGDARDSWYQGRLFLKERIEEEEKEIEKKFDLLKKQKEKGEVLGVAKGVGYEELELEEIPIKERIPIDVKRVRATSKKAVFVELFDGRVVWIPKSCIRGGDKYDKVAKGVKTMLFVDLWFLEKNNIVY